MIVLISIIYLITFGILMAACAHVVYVETNQTVYPLYSGRRPTNIRYYRRNNQ